MACAPYPKAVHNKTVAPLANFLKIINVYQKVSFLRLPLSLTPPTNPYDNPISDPHPTVPLTFPFASLSRFFAWQRWTRTELSRIIVRLGPIIIRLHQFLTWFITRTVYKHQRNIASSVRSCSLTFMPLRLSWWLTNIELSQINSWSVNWHTLQS